MASNGTGTAENTRITILLFSLVLGLALPWMKSVIRLCYRDKVFATLSAWGLLSCLWSQFPLVSLEWAPVAALNTIFAFYLYRRFSPEQQIRLLLILGWICLGLSILVSVCFPRYGTLGYGSWRGIYPQKNMCSITTTLLLLGALYVPATSQLSQLFRVVYVGLSVLLIVMTQSATGKISLVCLAAYLLTTRLGSKVRAQEKRIVLIIGTLLTLVLVVAGIYYERYIALFLGKDQTLTGRTEIWQALIPVIMKHPIVGYGYRAFWRGYEGESASVAYANHWAVTSAHNGFLEVWLTLGAVGVILVVYSLLRAIRDACVCLRAGRCPYLGWYACIIFLVIVTSVDEGELVMPNNLMWILYMIACVGLSEGARRSRLGMDRG